MESKKLSLSVKSFINSMIVIIVLMIASYVLTLVLPAGNFLRIEDSGIIFTDELNPFGIYSEVSRNFPFWKFILSPFLALGSEGGTLLIAIMGFILIIGGIFACLGEQNILEYFLIKTVNKFYKRRYLLLSLLILCFMLLSTFAGCFEEFIPLVPIMVSLSISLGWDAFTGIAITMLSSGCGFAAGITNPFGTGIAQSVANVSPFSGIWLRIVTFIVLYVILTAFIMIRAKKIENKNINIASDIASFQKDEKYEKGTMALLLILGSGILFIICSTFISALQDYTLIAFGLCFLIGGILSCMICKMPLKKFLKTFASGAIGMIGPVVMILFASSIKYILTESNTIDTLIKYLMDASKNLSPLIAILFVYLIVLLMELFVPSGSAKAYIVMPLLCPIASVMGISSNLVVLAYIFGDGLANAIYPTNPGLLISLSLADMKYTTYFKKSWLLIVLLLIATSLILLLGFSVNYV